MRKMLSAILLICVCGAGYAASTCIHNNTGVFILKKSVNGVSSSYDADNYTWSVKFDYDLVPNNSSYRTLTGNATCNNIETNTAGGAITSGEPNTHLRASNSDVGSMCWCSMTAPISSWWVFYKKYDTAAACSTGCARDCASAVKSNTNNFRTGGVYMAIW